jgi:octaprenyl-diphosphate synthase
MGDKAHAETIREAILNGGRDNIQEVMKAIESTDAIEYTAHRARQEADLALSMLQNIPESEYKDALVNLAEFSVNRAF